MSIDKMAPGLILVYPPVGLIQVAAVTPPATKKGVVQYSFLAPYVLGKPTIYVDETKANENGLRRLSTRAEYHEALAILRQCKRFYGRASSLRSKYSFPAWQQQILSGDIKNYARIMRDFYRAPGERPMKPQEKQIFNEALTRLSTEAAAILGWSTAPQIGTLKQQLLRLLTLPRTGLPRAEEERTMEPVLRNPVVNVKTLDQPIHRITAPRVGVDKRPRRRSPLPVAAVKKITR